MQMATNSTSMTRVAGCCALSVQQQTSQSSWFVGLAEVRPSGQFQWDVQAFGQWRKCDLYINSRCGNTRSVPETCSGRVRCYVVMCQVSSSISLPGQAWRQATQ